MRGSILPYITAWSLAMAPLIGLIVLLHLANNLFGIDGDVTSVVLIQSTFDNLIWHWPILRHTIDATPVVLIESAVRDICLFVNVSLGASIGAITYQALVKDQGPETIH
jgi:hypothetical protein